MEQSRSIRRYVHPLCIVTVQCAYSFGTTTKVLGAIMLLDGQESSSSIAGDCYSVNCFASRFLLCECISS